MTGSGMLGGGFLGGILGSLSGKESCQAKIEACQKRIDLMTDIEVEEIIEGNFEKTLKGLKETEKNLQMKLRAAITENNHMTETKLQNDITSFFDSLVGTLKDRLKISKLIDAYKKSLRLFKRHCKV